jgi:hypothetical protein
MKPAHGKPVVDWSAHRVPCRQPWGLGSS